MTGPDRRDSNDETKLCPKCGGTLVFRNHHPILTVGNAHERTGSEIGDRMRYVQAWVCLNASCEYREVLEDA